MNQKNILLLMLVALSLMFSGCINKDGSLFLSASGTQTNCGDGVCNDVSGCNIGNGPEECSNINDAVDCDSIGCAWNEEASCSGDPDCGMLDLNECSTIGGCSLIENCNGPSSVSCNSYIDEPSCNVDGCFWEIGMETCGGTSNINSCSELPGQQECNNYGCAWTDEISAKCNDIGTTASCSDFDGVQESCEMFGECLWDEQLQKCASEGVINCQNYNYNQTTCELASCKFEPSVPAFCDGNGKVSIDCLNVENTLCEILGCTLTPGQDSCIGEINCGLFNDDMTCTNLGCDWKSTCQGQIDCNLLNTTVCGDYNCEVIGSGCSDNVDLPSSFNDPNTCILAGYDWTEEPIENESNCPEDCDGGNPSEEICHDGLDNDGDGDIDCEDWDCEGQICVDGVCENGLCIENQEIPECEGNSVETCEGIDSKNCANSYRVDGSQCGDIEGMCTVITECEVPQQGAVCGNSNLEDGEQCEIGVFECEEGFDCEDCQCIEKQIPECTGNPVGDCTLYNGDEPSCSVAYFENDNDLAQCVYNSKEDTCSAGVECEVAKVEEICGNGLDDDGNGDTDCDDAACAGEPDCQTPECPASLTMDCGKYSDEPECSISYVDAGGYFACKWDGQVCIKGSTCEVAQQCDDINFIDQNLNDAVCQQLGDNQGCTVDTCEALTLTELWASGNNINDLGGIEYLTNLQSLDLNSNQLTDVGSLSGLTNLHSLYLSGNQISDVSDLSGLTTLSYLTLNNNQISDVSSLSGLTNIYELHLESNQLNNIEGLSGLTGLQSLHLDLNQLTNLNELSILTNLYELYSRENQLSDVSGLSGLTNLQFLYLDYNQISDVSSLSGLTNLQSLNLNYNQISDVNSLSGLINLQYLILQSNQISNIEGLSSLTNLQELGLHDNQLTDITPLPDTTNGPLNNIEINSNCLDVSEGTPNYDKIQFWQSNGVSVNYEPQNNCEQQLPECMGTSTPTCEEVAGDCSLYYIFGVDGTQCAESKGMCVGIGDKCEAPQQCDDINFADQNLNDAVCQQLGDSQGCTVDTCEALTLTELDANGRSISDLTGIEYLTNLQTLDLAYNQLSDIGALSGLSSLQTLGLGSNQLSDIGALSGLSSLQFLNLGGNQLSDITSLPSTTNGPLMWVSLEFNCLDVSEGTPNYDKIQFWQGNNVEVNYEPQNNCGPQLPECTGNYVGKCSQHNDNINDCTNSYQDDAVMQQQCSYDMDKGICFAKHDCDLASPEICNNGKDDDWDNYADCADLDCFGQFGPQGEFCEPDGETICDDGFDNDNDGSVDQDDKDCQSSDCMVANDCPDGCGDCVGEAYPCYKIGEELSCMIQGCNWESNSYCKGHDQICDGVGSATECTSINYDWNVCKWEKDLCHGDDNFGCENYFNQSDCESVTQPMTCEWVESEKCTGVTTSCGDVPLGDCDSHLGCFTGCYTDGTKKYFSDSKCNDECGGQNSDCGDGILDKDEECEAGVQDCGLGSECVDCRCEIIDECGNGVCDDGENEVNCPTDCSPKLECDSNRICNDGRGVRNVCDGAECDEAVEVSDFCSIKSLTLDECIAYGEVYYYNVNTGSCELIIDGGKCIDMGGVPTSSSIPKTMYTCNCGIKDDPSDNDNNDNNNGGTGSSIKLKLDEASILTEDGFIKFHVYDERGFKTDALIVIKFASETGEEGYIVENEKVSGYYQFDVKGLGKYVILATDGTSESSLIVNIDDGLTGEDENIEDISIAFSYEIIGCNEGLYDIKLSFINAETNEGIEEGIVYVVDGALGVSVLHKGVTDAEGMISLSNVEENLKYQVMFGDYGGIPISYFSLPKCSIDEQDYSSCGDGICNADETCIICPEDCGNCDEDDSKDQIDMNLNYIEMVFENAESIEPSFAVIVNSDVKKIKELEPLDKKLAAKYSKETKEKVESAIETGIILIELEVVDDVMVKPEGTDDMIYGVMAVAIVIALVGLYFFFGLGKKKTKKEKTLTKQSSKTTKKSTKKQVKKSTNKSVKRTKKTVNKTTKKTKTSKKGKRK